MTKRRVTLAELMIVAATLGIVASIAIPLHVNAQARARIEQAQADLQMLALGVRQYKDHMGTLPEALTVLTAAAVNDRNQSAGPFVTTVPAPPRGGTPPWGAYTYASSSTGTFVVTVSGDGTTITLP
jgi:Tfp pilus assembly protein PilE